MKMKRMVLKSLPYMFFWVIGMWVFSLVSPLTLESWSIGSIGAFCGWITTLMALHERKRRASQKP